MSWTPPSHGDRVMVVTGEGHLIRAHVHCTTSENGNLFPWVAQAPGTPPYACVPEMEGVVWARGWDHTTQDALEAANKLLRSAS